MRVTFSTGYTRMMADLESAASELAKRQEEVSSGLRMQSPSDDPSSWAAGVRERAEIGVVDQYSSTVDSANSRLTVADTVLTDLVAKLTSTQATILAGQGTIQTDSQREATAKELEGLRDAVFDDLNTTFSGIYLFSGAKGLTAPYVRNADGTISAYQGDATRVEVDVDRTRSVKVSIVGSDLSLGSEPEDLFTTFSKAIAAVRSGDQTAMETTLGGIKAAFDRVVSVQSTVGADLRALEDQGTRLDQTKLAAKTRLSALEDANMAESVTSMGQASTAYKSALSALATRSNLSLLDYLS